MNSTSRLACWLVMEAVTFGWSQAETNPSAQTPPTANDPFPPLPGIFNSELPRMILPADLRVSIRPRFGDLQTREHLRLNWGLRYGLSPQWELSSEIESYMANGLRGASLFSTNGISKVSFGVKHRFEEFLTPFWDTAAGLTYSTPVGNPPAELTDGLRHIMPYMTMEHVFKRHPLLTGFVSYGFDFSSKAIAQENPDANYGADTWFITPGLTWRQGRFKYTLEVPIRSSFGLDSGNTYEIAVRPGLTWTLPRQLTFNSRNRWVFGLALNAGYSNNGSNFGVSSRLQTDFDFRRIFYTPKTPNLSRR